MKALITGASSGIGRDFAYMLSDMGYDIVIAARRKERLDEIKEKLKGRNVEVYTCDLSSRNACFKLFEEHKDTDVLINNAGFGVFGEFDATPLDKELEMLDVNISALHILTKLYYREMVKRNSGYILNVASSAAFFPGPLFSSYYASKAYVLRLTRALSYELKKKKSNVHIGVLCPGPVDTEFNSVAGVKFGVGSITSKYAAEYGLKKLFAGRVVIVPSVGIKLLHFLSKISPSCISEKIVYRIQKAKK